MKPAPTLNSEWNRWGTRTTTMLWRGARLVLKTEDQVFGVDPLRTPDARRAATRLLSPGVDLPPAVRRAIEVFQALSI